jgi:hypothetical protein
MSGPASPEHGTLFDLTALERELRSDSAREQSGHTARTSTRTADVRVVLITMTAR